MSKIQIIRPNRPTNPGELFLRIDGGAGIPIKNYRLSSEQNAETELQVTMLLPRDEIVIEPKWKEGTR